MKFGVCIPNYGDTLSVEGLRNIALTAERLGYDSLWATDHILMSRNSSTPYERIFDSIVSLAYLAPQTTNVKLGISSLIIAMRNPVIVAKQLASIDVLSRGRVILAIGAGWNEREFSTLGVNLHDRGKRVNESIRLIRNLWEGGTDFKSEIIPQSYTDCVFEPRPIQNKLTIWIGGASKASMRRAAKLGDAWHPNVLQLDRFRGLISQFRKEFPEAHDKQICVRIALNIRAKQSEYVGPQGDRRVMLSSNMSQNKEIISELEKLGISYIVIASSPDGKVSVQDQIDGLKTIAGEFIK